MGPSVKADRPGKPEGEAEVACSWGLPNLCPRKRLEPLISRFLSKCSPRHQWITWLPEEQCLQRENVLPSLLSTSRLLEISKFHSGLFSAPSLVIFIQAIITSGTWKMEFLSLYGWWSEPDEWLILRVSVPWWKTLCLGSTGTPLWGPLWLRALPTGNPHRLSKTSGLGQEVGLSSAAKQNHVWSSPARHQQILLLIRTYGLSW